MTTTSIHPGHSVSGILNHVEWGDGYSETEQRRLDAAIIGKFEELAREHTGDPSLAYQPYTSEILYECWGQTTDSHHCLDPKTTWRESDIEWGEIAREAGEWVAEHLDTFLDENPD